MRALGLVSLTLPADDPAAARSWWAQALQLSVAEDDDTALELGDAVLRFGSETALRVVAQATDELPVTLVDPGGTHVEVVAPDLAAAQCGEDSIQAFVEGAGDLPGRPVEELADEVAAMVLEVRDRIHRALVDVPNNKRLAVYLSLGQRARQADPAAPPWHLHAASTLMSGTFGGGD